MHTAIYFIGSMTDRYCASSNAYSGDREHRFRAMVNSAWSRQLEGLFLLQVFTIRQGSSAV